MASNSHNTSNEHSYVDILLKVRNEYANGDWARFNELVAALPPGNKGYRGLYFPLPEIIPPNVRRPVHFRSEDPQTPPIPVGDLPDAAHPRAILESQLLSIRARVAAILQ